MSTSTSPPAKVPMWLNIQLLAAIPFAVARGVFAKQNAKRSWKRAAHLSVLQEVLKRLSRVDARIAQQVIGGSTGATYRAWASERRLPITSEDIGDGGYLHWIGEKKLGKVLLYFHGGGYAFPASSDCFDSVLALKQDVDGHAGGVGAVFLEYSLTPGAPFPTQLRQALSALTNLLSQGVLASNIVLGGDSAGGNLILQLFSHFLHPLPGIPPPPVLSVPLAGALLVSPWTSFSDKYQSFKSNAREDVLHPEVYMYFARIASAGITDDTRGHFEPATVSPEWWTGLGNVSPKVLITIGEKECLFDQVVDLSRSLEPHTQVQTALEENGVHESFIFAFGAGSQEGRAGSDYKSAVAWLKSVLA